MAVVQHLVFIKTSLIDLKIVSVTTDNLNQSCDYLKKFFISKFAVPVV